jgi:acyl-CoA synthetase (AMP-forming)/AMP-acid ligase II
MDQLTIPAVFQAAVAGYPDGEALVFPDTRLSYRQLDERAQCFATSLMGLGIRPGDAVGILMPNAIDNVATFLAATIAGAFCVPINSRFRPRELAHVIADSGMRVLVTSDIIADHVDFAERLGEAFTELEKAAIGTTPALEHAPGLEHIVMLGKSEQPGMLTEQQFIAAGAQIDKADQESRSSAITSTQYAMMLYTSGTTAMPKGCAIKHGQLVSVSSNIAERLGLEHGDRLWNALPMFHASSLLPLLAAFHKQATFISLVHFDPGEALQQLYNENVTLAWPAYTTIWQPVLTHQDFDPDRLGQLRGLLCVGPRETLEMMEKALPRARVMSCYGLTECSGLPVMPWFTDTAKVRYGTCGRPMEGIEVQIRDPEIGEELAAGKRGALWMRGDYVIDGYWNDPIKTAQSFDPEGWFNTGDMASMDDEGYLYFHGRLKDTLKVGGENVAAVEVEAYLSTHPSIKIAAVVGIPDEKYGEVPVAFIEFRPGKTAQSEELIAFCRKGLAGFKVPRLVREVSEWPMSATKIRKEELRTSLLQELGTATN